MRKLQCFLFLIFIVSTLALEGCGFRLRGSQQIAISLPAVFVQSSGTTIESKLKSALKNAGVVIAKNQESAGVLLRLYNEKRNRRVLSVSTTGKVQEYELHYTIHFEVLNSAARLIYGPEVINIIGDYSFAETDVLSKDTEQQTLYQDMRSDATREIIRRIQAQAEKINQEQSNETEL